MMVKFASGSFIKEIQFLEGFIKVSLNRFQIHHVQFLYTVLLFVQFNFCIFPPHKIR